LLGVLNVRGVAKYSNFGPIERSKAISRKQCKIGGKLVLIFNRKSYYELSIGTKIDDLEHHNGSKLWYQFPGVCLEVCLLVTDTHTALQRTWLVDTGAAAADEPQNHQLRRKNLGFSDGRFLQKT